MNFTHLHVHTEYSLLDGSNKIKEYVRRVKELGMDSAAITDHGAMYGVIDFYRAAKAEGIRPILGCEVYVAPGSRFDRNALRDGASGEQAEERYYHLVLLAENNQGYQNLMKIVSKGYVEGFYYKPRVDMEVLRMYHEGIIALSACLAGVVPRCLQRGMYEEAKKAALEHLEIFGEDNYFLELQDHGIPAQKLVNQQLVRMSQELGIPLVATNDVHYTFEEDVAAHDVLLCLQTGKKLSDENRMRYEGGQYFVKSPEQMAELFPYAPQALENTHKIAERCHVEIEFGVTKLPRFDVPSPYTSWEYLNKLCSEGLVERYGEHAEEIRPRLDYELSVIQKMGYVDYFLIVWDFIHYAREHDIMVGPGRGSAAGSVVSYALGITKLDPIRYSLLFERFLNPERVSMPDIDVDFCFERRQEVIDYVVRKYGKDRVVQIVTFGTMAARGVIRDVGRVMDLPYALCDSISKMVPKELDITLDKALEMSQDLRKAYEGDEQIHALIDMSKRLEGLPRHTSMHAAGVVISQKSVDEYVPLSRASDGTITTQFTMTTLEELGLLKMDFLGLRTLTVIQNAVKLAETSSGRTINIDEIDFDDKAVYDSLSTGRTDGVFQLESTGMKNFMKELKPSSLEDVIAGISLYRPGPMDFIPKYIYGKNHPEDITYDCPQLEPILEPTYGCIVYQEQVMQIVRDLGGYTLGRSDLVRRAMSKKKASVMAKERQNFVYGNEEEGVPGCIAKGIDEKTANKIFDEMTDFARYAFNKSHGAAYAVVSYETAWLKYYYPVEYMAALMTSVIDNPGKVAEYTITCKHMGIEILPPDINTGVSGFSVEIVTRTGSDDGLPDDRAARISDGLPDDRAARISDGLPDNSAVRMDDGLTSGRGVSDSSSAQTDSPDTVSGKAVRPQNRIRYALSAIKSIGRSVIDSVVAERERGGPFRSLQNFIERVSGFKDVSKRTIEALIKAGAMDCFGTTRKQMLMGYAAIMDQVAAEKKDSVSGQISLFDLLGEDAKREFEGKLPDVGEFDKEQLLAFEKEVLGIYVSGHPLERYEEKWRGTISNLTTDFQLDEETNLPHVQDGARAVIGGMITNKTVKYTKKNQTMAFLTLEDLVGTVEVVVFPRDYETYNRYLTDDNKIFVRGRVSNEDDRPGKLICERIWPFEQSAPATGNGMPDGYLGSGGTPNGYAGGGMPDGYLGDGTPNGYRGSGIPDRPAGSGTRDAFPKGAGSDGGRARTDYAVPKQQGNGRELWIQFSDKQEYAQKESRLFDVLRESEGEDYVVIYVRSERAVRHLGANWAVDANEELVAALAEIFGAENVKFKQKNK
ncbi:MAG: DNA polymerase III subunit alpha [Lachnospiraceae bacterium]|nr:DNA polymerase III subunit alpha [Lachnospiraceae bacterium]